MIGLFFGSFNPIHHGHLLLARYAYNELALEAVWFVLSPQSPHKIASDLAPVSDRLEMLRLALAEAEGLAICSVELELPQPSYTIQTLRHLERQYPGQAWVVLIGADAFLGIPTWRAGLALLEHYTFWVYPRAGVTPAQLPASPAMRYVAEAPRFDLSATYIRECIQAGKSIHGLVPEPVRRYILEKRLYATS